MTVPSSCARAAFLAAVVSGALVLAGCSGAVAPETGGATGTRDAGPTASATATPEPEPEAATRTGGPSTVPELLQVAWADAPRELSEIEREFMYEPGPYAGDAYDEAAVVAAVVAMNPTTLEEWQRAIQSQIQGDYVADARAAILFDPSLSEAAGGPTEGSAPVGEAVGSNHFALVLDASGSMADASSTGTRMEEAKAALADFVSTLPEGATVSLRVYGHEGDNTDAGKAESCRSSETIYQGPADDAQLRDALQDVQPTGWTPLATAVADAAGDIPRGATDGIVYVVTDGIESCGGDPVEAAEELAASGLRPVVNVIGFQAGDADQQALAAIAEAGGGEYTAVQSGADLTRYWEEEYSRMMDAWEEWRSAELRRIEEEGRAKLQESEEIGTRLLDGPETEGARALDLVERLGSEGHLEPKVKQELWSHFYDRKLNMWKWAYDLKLENWNAAYRERNQDWNAVYAQGNSKWMEYYRKQHGLG